MSRNLTELNKLEEYLKANGIEYERIDEDNKLEMFGSITELDYHQIKVGVTEEGPWDWDVICNRGSYGCEQGLLEGMGSIFEDDVEGWLTAEDVIKRIEEAGDGEQ